MTNPTRINEIALTEITEKQLQRAIRSMNKVSKEFGAKVAPKGTKEVMATEFVDTVALVIEKSSNGLDAFINPVQNLYRALTGAANDENATDGKSGGQNGKDIPEPKPTKRTRGSVFAEMLANAPKPGTRKQWAVRYLTAYGGSEAESEFRVGVYMDLLTHMGLVEVDKKGVHTFIG